MGLGVVVEVELEVGAGVEDVMTGFWVVGLGVEVVVVEVVVVELVLGGLVVLEGVGFGVEGELVVVDEVVVVVDDVDVGNLCIGFWVDVVNLGVGLGVVVVVVVVVELVVEVEVGDVDDVVEGVVEGDCVEVLLLELAGAGVMIWLRDGCCCCWLLSCFGLSESPQLRQTLRFDITGS